MAKQCFIVILPKQWSYSPHASPPKQPPSLVKQFCVPLVEAGCILSVCTPELSPPAWKTWEGFITCSVPQQAALVSVLLIAPSISMKMEETKKVGQELPSSLLQPPPFPFTQKADPETTQSLFIPVLLVHAAGRMWVRQGLLCLIETQLSSVGSSLVRRLALEFSSCWKWGSCGSCSPGDERFSRRARAAHPCGGARTRGAARVRACSPPVCAAPGALRGAAWESGCSSDLLQS